MKRIIVIGALSAVGVLAVTFGSRALFKKTGVHRTRALVHAKQIFIALEDFDHSYGRFPDASTIAAVTTVTGTRLPLGTTTSNELFRQLIAAVTPGERIFWTKSAITPRYPDDVISGSHALEKGECSFAYVAGLSSASTPGKPVLLAPVDPARRCFERRRDYRECAVILFADGSVRPFPIDKHGKVMIDGMDVFDPRQPFWGGKAPDVNWPE